MRLYTVIVVFLTIALGKSHQKSVIRTLFHNQQPFDFSNFGAHIGGKTPTFAQWETREEENGVVFNNSEGKETELIVKAMEEEKTVGGISGLESKRSRRSPRFPGVPKEMPSPSSMPEGIPSPPTPPEDMATPPSMPDGVPSPPSPPEGVTPPEGITPPEGVTPPEGITPLEGITPPGGMTPPAMP